MFESESEMPGCSGSLELAILEAGNSLLADQQLRPRVLEAAARGVERSYRVRKVGLWIAASLLLLVTINVLAVKVSQSIKRDTGLRSHELFSLACRISAESGCGIDWGLVDALQSFRESNARAVGKQPAKFLIPSR